MNVLRSICIIFVPKANNFIYSSMENKYWLIVAWLAFDILIYLWAAIDYIYYTHKIRQKLNKLKQVFTEE